MILGKMVPAPRTKRDVEIPVPRNPFAEAFADIRHNPLAVFGPNSDKLPIRSVCLAGLGESIE